MKKHTVLTICTALLVAAGITSCGNDNPVRPDGFNATGALGNEIKCTPDTLKSPVDPFIVEWSDGDRAALEAEMGNGMALIKYTCEGAKVLRGCSIPGADYKYKGISKKTKVLQMNDATSAQASLKNYTLPSSFRAAFDQGKALNLAYMMVGNQTNTVNSFNKAQVQAPHCKEATHFVAGATLGAFTLATGERGQAAAAGEVFGYGEASAETSSAKSVQASDGDPQTCEGANRSDREPVDGCAAITQINLVPLTEGDAKQASAAPVKVDTRSCDAGFVYVDGGCVAESDLAADEAFLCKEGDWKECRTQCDKGSDESCGRLGGMILSKHIELSVFYGLEDDAFATGPDNADSLSAKESAFLKDAEPQLDRMKAACQNVEPNACLVAAATLSIKNDGDDYPQTGATLREFAKLMEQGCRDGQSMACRTIAGIYSEDPSWAADSGKYGGNAIAKDVKKFEDIVSEGCDTGSAAACDQLADFFVGFFSFDDSFKPDFKKAAKYWGEACLGGISTACMYATASYVTNDPAQCESFLKSNLVEEELELCLGVPCSPTETKEIADFCKQTSGFENKARAYYASSKACYLEDSPENTNLCVYSIDLAQYAEDDE